MSIIQAIREKGSWLIIILVVLSLIGFILMDASVGRSGLLGGQSSTVGSIDRHPIDYLAYQDKYQKQQAQYEQSSGPMNEYARLNISNQVWMQFKERTLLSSISERLNLEVADNELASILTGDIELDMLKSVPAFLNPQTRQFDKNAFRTFMQNFKQRVQQDPQQQENLRIFIDDIKRGAIRQRYLGTLSGVEYTPRWLQKKQLAPSGRARTVNIVSLPYYKAGLAQATINPATVEAMSEKFKGIYVPKEARAVRYILAEGEATGEDTTTILTEMESLKPKLAASSNPSTLLSLTNAQIQYNKGYYTTGKVLSQLFPSQASQITKLPSSQVLGPFIARINPSDARNYYNLVRILGRKKVPNEVDVRHILVFYGGQSRTESEAKKRMDSVVIKLNSGTSFDALALEYSDDKGSNTKGGNYTFSYEKDYPTLDTAFRKAAFYGLPNTKRLVRTSYGYHYIEVLSHKNVEQGYELATASLAIEPSVATETKAANLANQFSIVAQSEGFEKATTSMDMEVLQTNPMVFSDFSSMPRIGYSYALVRWMFTKEKGDISAPIKVGDNYVVAQLMEIQSPETYLNSKVEENAANYLKQSDAVLNLPSYVSLQEVADSNQVKIYSGVTISPSTSSIEAESSKWDEPALVGYLTNPQRPMNKLLGPIQGKLAVYYAEIVSEDAAAVVDSSQVAFQESITQRVNRNYITQQSFSSYLDMMEEEDNRHLF